MRFVTKIALSETGIKCSVKPVVVNEVVTSLGRTSKSLPDLLAKLSATLTLTLIAGPCPLQDDWDRDLRRFYS